MCTIIHNSHDGRGQTVLGGRRLLSLLRAHTMSVLFFHRFIKVGGCSTICVHAERFP